MSDRITMLAEPPQNGTAVVSGTQFAQNAWEEERRPSTTSIKDPPKASSPTPDKSLGSSAEPDQEEDDFGEFQSVSTDPFKRPIYAQHEVDETENLLNVDSDPKNQVGVFVGAGLIEPLRLGLDSYTRMLRRSLMPTKRKLPSVRAKEAAQPENVCDQDTNVLLAWYRDLQDLAAAVSTEGLTMPNTIQELEVTDQKLSVNDAMQAASFPGARVTNAQRDETTDIDKMMEEEKAVWEEEPNT